MGLADFTITSQRLQVVDFSIPYQASTLTILTKTDLSSPSSSTSLVSSVLSPFSTGMWASVAVSVVMTILTLWLVARLSPSERRAGGGPASGAPAELHCSHRMRLDSAGQQEEDESVAEGGAVAVAGSPLAVERIGGLSDAAWFVVFSAVFRGFSSFPQVN